MAAPAVAATATSALTTDATSHTVSLPASIAAGDLLITTFGWTSNCPQTISWPAGYTPGTGAKIEHTTVVGIDAAYRWADGTEGATISVGTSGLTKSTHNSYRITGAENPSTQAPEFVAVSGTSAGAPDSPNLTPTGGSKDYLWLTSVNADGETDIAAAPTNFTNLVTATTGISGATSINCRMGSARRTLTAASEDPGTWTNTSTSWTTQTIAIHPAGGGAVTVDPYPYVGGGYYPVEG